MTMLTPEDRARLRDLAAKATPGPWAINTEGWADISSGPDSVIHAYSVRDSCHECGEPYDHDPRVAISTEDAEFIAAAGPATVTALLDALDQAERERDEARATKDMHKERAERIVRDGEAAIAAVERVRALHHQIMDEEECPSIRDLCAECYSMGSWETWPCSTVRAMDGEA